MTVQLILMHFLTLFLVNLRSKEHKSQRKKEERQSSMRLRWPSEELSIRFSLNCKEINKKWHIKRSNWKNLAREMNRVFKDKNNLKEIP
jgi:hypothetical protein